MGYAPKENLFRFAHNWNGGNMEYWNNGSASHCVEKYHDSLDNLSWIEKISTEVLKSSVFRKTPLPFMFWPVGYLLTLHSN